MAGPGVAVRLHEFKERHGAERHHGASGVTKTRIRQGRDVLGLYPGQLGRVHVIHSTLYRPRLTSVECPPWSEKLEERYQRSFDLLTLQALDLERVKLTPYTHPTACTTYQEEFGRQSQLYSPDDTKMTLRSFPAPLDC
ncbi:hypothetical protein AOLI_G00236740 [Acnodon oligacanthus]